MENASKALMMAAGVLLGIMLISIAVYAFNSFGEYAKEYTKQQELQQIAAFNTQFLIYEGRTDLTAHDVVTIANLAKQNNKSYEIDEPSDSPYYITVNVDKIQNNIEQKDDDFYYNFLNEYLENYKEDAEENLIFSTFTCESVVINEETNKVELVTIKRNK